MILEGIKVNSWKFAFYAYLRYQEIIIDSIYVNDLRSTIFSTLFAQLYQNWLFFCVWRSHLLVIHKNIRMQMVLKQERIFTRAILCNLTRTQVTF